MSVEDNKALVDRFIAEVLNIGNVGLMEEFTVPGSMFAEGKAGQLKVMRIAIPDWHFHIEDIFGEGDTVCVRGSFHGTHSGPMHGFPALGKLEQPVPPSGANVSGEVVMVFRLKGGKIVSYTELFDTATQLRQMGWTFTPPG